MFARTLSNYFGYVKTGCLLCREPTEVRTLPRGADRAQFFSSLCQVFESPAVRRAVVAAEKRQNFAGREPMWIQRCVDSGFVT